MIASAKSKFLLGSIFFAFFSYGLFAAVTGSLSVPIMDFYVIDSAQRGLMITLQGLGGLLMVLFSMFFGDRFNKFGLFLAGLVLMSATGLFLASKPSLALFMLMLFFWGGGIMLVDTISNSLIADNFRKNQDRYVPYLHLSYGIGIFISNAVTKLILDHIHVQAWLSFIGFLVWLAPWPG